ncbi:hypothetical protein [Deinococcus ficus]|uniref:hypothetical protein n=1 Tax=Deinococcus ficus TaxID=317577 RepID=UPI00174D70AE|nr:hypothetical protein [Deinococcus ficus]GHF80399.1 hypothetical protein GCM10017782_17900 [Deinococcus ficus]
MSTWTSLDLTLDTSALPENSEATLRDRWETQSGPPAPYPVTVQVADFPDLTAPERTVTVSNATTTLRTTKDQVQIGPALLHLTPDHATLTLRTPELPELTALLLFSELHRARGWLPLHASTAARNGHAVSITGPSGAGKSTAALRLAGLGYTVLAEDQTWLHPETRRVHGLDCWLRAYPDSLERFAPQLLPQSQGTDVYGKHLLSLSRTREAATLEALLFLGQPADIPAAQATRLLWEASGLPLTLTVQQATAHAISQVILHLHIRETDREGLLDEVECQLGPAVGVAS